LKTFWRIVRSLIVLGFLLLSLTAGAGATSHPRFTHIAPLPKSPLSGSVLMAQAIHSGKIKLPRSTASRQYIHPRLTCTPTPCALPNVQASEGGQPVDEDPIATNPTNAQNLLTGGNDYNCPSLTGFYTSTDGGNSWTTTCMNTLSGFGCGDPGVGYDLNNNAYITGIDCGQPAIIFEKSTDGGPWSAPAIAVNPLFYQGFTDKPWLQIDDNPSSPFANSLYISVTQFDAAGDSTISVSHSRDGGATWSVPIYVDWLQLAPAVDQFSDMTIGADGTVYVTWMRCPGTGPTGDCGGTTATFYFAKSTDGGNTWSAPAPITTATLAPDTCSDYYGTLPNTCERVSDIPVVGIDNSTDAYHGDLYVAFYNWTGSFMQVEVTTSTNGGATWSTPVPVAPSSDTHDQFFPWLSVGNSGAVGVTWLDRRNDPSNLSYEAFAGVSTDGGATFPNLQIATQPSNPNNDGFGGMFMGDYTGNAWDNTGNTLYASWMDTRNGVNTQDEVGGEATISAESWSIVPSPSPGPTYNYLYGTAALSASNAWAVGYYVNANGDYRTLTEQWNGTSWNVVPSPSPGTSVNALLAATAVPGSTTLVWAVGAFLNTSGVYQTLVERWNGTRWSVVSSPNAGSAVNVLNGITAIASNNIWAVGYYQNAGGHTQTLIEHWNGTSWRIVTSPNVGTGNNLLNGVAAVSATDVWAVGAYRNPGYKTLIEQWNGSSWSVISSPNPSTSSNYLIGVTAVSSNQVWAFGNYGTSSTTNHVLVEEWTGSSWNVVSTPNPGASINSLSQGAVVSPTDIWAVGNYSNNGTTYQTLIEQWNGSAWSFVPSPSPGSVFNYLNAITVTPGTNSLWAVGNYANSSSGPFLTLIEQH